MPPLHHVFRQVSLWALAAVSTMVVTTPALAETRFWFGSEDPITLRDKHRAAPADFMELFLPDAPWQHVASELAVFKLSTQFILSASDDMLRTVFTDLRRRHLKIAVEIGTVVRLDACGKGEGYAPPDLSDRVGRRLTRLGLVLDYMAADNPVWNAHERTWGKSLGGATKCEYPVNIVADRVAMSFKAMQRYFPDIQIGEIDVLSTDPVPGSQLVADYVAFAQLLERDIGQRMAFFHGDTAWSKNGESLIGPLKRQMNALGIRFGVIIGGGPEQATDEEWVQEGVRRLNLLLNDPATRPDDIIIQSWQPRPTHILPETLPGTYTYLLRYAEDMVRK